MGQARPIRQNLQQSLRVCATALAFSFLGAFGAHAQDAAEAARQEKARKAAAPEKSDKHVYSNDDLNRSQILAPEQRARVEARKKNSTTPGTNEPAQSLDATNSDPSVAPAESLGEVARRFRREKTVREAEQALKVSPRSGFPMNLSQPTLATPAPVRVPKAAVAAPLRVPSVIISVPSLRPPRAPAVAASPVKRDPFSHPSRAPLSRPAPEVVAPSPAPNLAVSAPPASAVAPPTAARVPAASPRKSLTAGPKSIATATPGIPSAIAPAPYMLPTPKTIAPVDTRANITVHTGDSLWKLARQHLGKGSRWPEMLAANPGLVDLRRIWPGTTLVVPQIVAPQTSSPRTSARRAAASPGDNAALQISVTKGVSLWKIAKAQLGSGAHWHCLAEANPQLHDPDRIYPGQMLLVPSSCSRP
jgi:nucleoid-associated protein YgaU